MTNSYEPVIFKFSGAGNDFVVLDGRQGGMEPFREPARIGALCQEYHTDGLMILTTPVMADLDRPSLPDFVMEFYNPDGSGGMMCGNGGRCIVAFADYLGLKPASPDGIWHFLAPDGMHEAQILQRPGTAWTVKLKMIDVQEVQPMMGGYFLNTGTRPEGTNANFVQVTPEGLRVRTFEKGVEGETLACGTGLTASAIAAYKAEIPGQAEKKYHLQCRRGDWLQVAFREKDGRFTDVYLTGPAELIIAHRA